MILKRKINYDEAINATSVLFMVVNTLLVAVVLVAAGSAVFSHAAAGENTVSPVLDSTNPYDIVWDSLTVADKMQWAATEVQADSYEHSTEDMAIAAWNKLNKKGVPAVLVYGNLSMRGESIMKCNRLWVAVDTAGVSVDTGVVFNDTAHREGYRISSPAKYHEIETALDDTKKAETAYLNAVNTYNTELTDSSHEYVKRTQLAYEMANERLVNLVREG